MTFSLSFFAAGIGIAAAIYLASALALLFRAEWKEGAGAFGVALVPASIYALSWKFLPMENWLILPGIFAGIIGTITFITVLRNGV